jgi:hypothetical protein
MADFDGNADFCFVMSAGFSDGVGGAREKLSMTSFRR